MLSLNEFEIPSYETWIKLVQSQNPKLKLYRKNDIGITIKPIYQNNDVDILANEMPFIGDRLSGRIINKPDINQTFFNSISQEFNRNLKKEWFKDFDIFTIVLDKAGRLGLDPDNCNRDYIGSKGLSIIEYDDLTEAFKGVDISLKKIHIDAGASTLAFVCMLIKYIQSKKIALSKWNGCLIFDPIGLILSHEGLNRSIEDLYNDMSNLLLWSKQHAPLLKTIGINGKFYSDCGANAVQELAFSIATATEYIKEMLKRGIKIDTVAQKMSFFLSIGSDFFTEISKFRAARFLWSKIISLFEGNSNSQQMEIHAFTSNWNKTLFDSSVNILRATTEALSGILSGCESINVASFNELNKMPDDFSRRIARNTLKIIFHECKINQLVDPAGGSYYVEKMTNQIAEKAWELFQDVEKSGGMLKAVENGEIQDRIYAEAAKKEEAISKRKRIIVGTNKYVKDEFDIDNNYTWDEKLVNCQISKINKLKDMRDNQSATLSIKSISESSTGVIIDRIISAISKKVTLGEITTAIKKPGEKNRIVKVLYKNRASKNYENIRKMAFKYKEKTGCFPKVYLANFGKIDEYKKRAEFSKSFFKPGGFSIIHGNGFTKVKDAVENVVLSKPQIAVICSSEDGYKEFVAEFSKQLKKVEPSVYIVVAGYLDDFYQKFKNAGVDEFIYTGSNNYKILKDIYTKIGFA